MSQSIKSNREASPTAFPGFVRESAMTAKVRAFDWRATPLGEPAEWPPELVAAASFVLESKMPAALIWGPELVTIYNDAFAPILGDKPEALGRPFSETWAEIWPEVAPIAAKAFAGEATFIEDFPLVVARNGHDEQAYFTFCYSPVRLADGSIAGIMDTVIETTRAVEALERERMAAREMGHRQKNSAAVIQAIAAQTFKDIPDRAALEAFQQRIGAFGRATDILLRTEWRAAAIATVAREAIDPHCGGGRVDIGGEDFDIGPALAYSLSLVLHELCTNAVKHGALRVPEGRVKLSWRRAETDLVVQWREHDGPPVAAPTEIGFGSRIIEGGLMSTRAVERRYLPGGFEADFRAPLSRMHEH